MPSKWAEDDQTGPDLYITGGAHGLTVEYGELEAVAGVLEGSVAQLTSLRSRCAEMYLLLVGTSAVHAHARQAAHAAELAIGGLERNMAELEEAAEGLRQTARNYSESEGRLVETIKWLAVDAPLGVDIWRNGDGGLPERAVTELIVPPFDGFLIQKLMDQLAERRFGELRSINVTRLEGNHQPVPLDGSVRGLLERSKSLLDAPDRGVVEVLTVSGGEHPVRIVTLPGNQDSGDLLVGPNPFDNYGNAEGRAEGSRYVAAAVAEALRQAGASAEDSVILVGYSQGGIHAVNAGARLTESGEFSVEMIVTAGSPAGDKNAPDGAKVLHFEHYQDFVPGLDGTANPDTPDRVTVTGVTPVEGGPEGGLGPAHDLNIYLQMADQAGASTDPSLNESLGYLAEIIPPASIATRGLFRFSRKQAAKPVKKPANQSQAPKPSPSAQAPPLPPGTGQ